MTSVGQQFLATAGSIVGREHVRVHKNNQDGYAIASDGDTIVAAVTDGCSSSKYSEVGARLAAAWLARCATTYAPGPTTPERPEQLGDALIDFLSSVCIQMSPRGMPIDDLLHHYFLFTYLCVVVTQEETWIVGQGDGVFSVNGTTRVLDSGPDNAPRYPAYRLADPNRLKGGAQTVHGGRPSTLYSGPTASLESLVIGTDGLVDLMERADEPLNDGTRQGGIEQFERENRFITNPTLLHKKLVVIGEGHGRLRDDTTMVLIRRIGG